MESTLEPPPANGHHENQDLPAESEAISSRLVAWLRPLRRRPAPLGLAAALGALGLGLSALELGEPSLWVDEAFTWFFVTQPWKDLILAARLDGVNPPLYYVLSKLTTEWFGTSESGLRALSVLAYFAGLGASFKLGRAVGGLAGGVAGGLFWAAHPMTVWFARDARPYALTAALASITLLAFVRLRRGASPAWWAIAFASLALGAISHYFFLVFVACLFALSLLELRRAPGFFRRWTILTLFSWLPMIGWLAWYLSQPQPSLGIGWIQKPGVQDLPLTWWNLVSGYGGVVDIPTTSFGAAVIAMIAVGAANRGRKGGQGWMLVLGLLAPVVALWMLSQYRPVYVDRYFIVLLPFIVLLVGAGGAQAWGRLQAERHASKWPPLPWALLLVVTATAPWAGAQVHLQEKYAKEDWRYMAGLLAGDPSAGPAWFSEPEAVLPLAYYGVRGFPPEQTQGLAVCASICRWVLRQPFTYTHAFTQSVSAPGRSWLPDLPATCERIWQWSSPTGLALWHLQCTGDGS